MPGMGKRRRKTPDSRTSLLVEKLILAQHFFKPAPAAIGNVP
jgi:hypothetical protein